VPTPSTFRRFVLPFSSMDNRVNRTRGVVGGNRTVGVLGHTSRSKDQVVGCPNGRAVGPVWFIGASIGASIGAPPPWQW
jgi:hypothetical protein